MMLYKYKAFISYSRAADGKLAPNLQKSLHFFTKPFFKLRIFQVFRDETSLPINSGLWSSIEDALKNSEYFILLASPDAAVSKWVKKEIDYWLNNRNADKLLIVLTDGNDIFWDDTKKDFNWDKTNSLPKNITQKFSEEPCWVDFRWIKRDEDLSLRNPKFLDGIASISAKLQNKDKDFLIGEDIRQHKKFQFIVTLISIILSFLLITTIFGWYYAEIQRQIAVKKSKISLSQELAAYATNYIDEKLDLSLLLSVEAYRVFDTLQAKKSLLDGLRFSYHLDTFLNKHKDMINDIIFSPDGKILISQSRDNIIIVWDISKQKPKQIRTIKEERYDIKNISINSNGQLFYSGNYENIALLWNMSEYEREQLKKIVIDKNESISDIAFNSVKEILALATTENTIILWDVSKKKPNRIATIKIKLDKQSYNKLTFSPDGKILALRSDKNIIILWDVSKDKPNYIGKINESKFVVDKPNFNYGEFLVNELTFSPDGKILASASTKNNVFIWNVKTQEKIGIIDGYEYFITSLAFSPDGKKIALGCFNGKVILWDVEKQKINKIFNGINSSVHSLAFSPDGKKIASGNYDGTIILWNVETQKEKIRKQIEQFFEKERDLIQFSFCSNNQLVATSIHNSIILWDVSKQEIKQLKELHGNFYNNIITLSPDGKKIVSGSYSYNPVILWDISTKENIIKYLFDGYRMSIFSAAFSSDNKTLALGSDKDVILWDVSKLNPILIGILKGHNDIINSVTFSSDGKILASGSYDKNIILWDVKTRKPIGKPLKGHNDKIYCITFSPDKKLLASGSRDGTIILWNLMKQRSIGKVFNGNDFISSLRFSSDSKILTSGDFCKVTLWDIETLKTIGEPLYGFDDEISCFSFSPDRMFMSARYENLNIINLEEINFVTLIEQAHEIVNRNLTYEEWDKFMGDEPYHKTFSDLSLPSDLPKKEHF